MNTKKLFDELNETRAKISRIKLEKAKLFELEKKEKELWKILIRSTMFDKKIIWTISELMSRIEKEEYSPFRLEYKNKETLIEYIGVTECKNITEMKNVESIDKLSNKYIIVADEAHYIKKRHGDNYCYAVPIYDVLELSGSAKRDNKHHIFAKSNILFKFILDGINAIYPFSDIAGYSTCEFLEHKYVRDFIEYLFDLQVQNNGKQLSYDEMQVALNDFIVLKNKLDKPKQKIKELTAPGDNK